MFPSRSGLFWFSRAGPAKVQTMEQGYANRGDGRLEAAGETLCANPRLCPAQGAVQVAGRCWEVPRCPGRRANGSSPATCTSGRKYRVLQHLRLEAAGSNPPCPQDCFPLSIPVPGTVPVCVFIVGCHYPARKWYLWVPPMPSVLQPSGLHLFFQT